MSDLFFFVLPFVSDLMKFWKLIKDVVSNKMIFDEYGKLIKFSEPMFHTFSKKTSLIGQEWKKTLDVRPNIVLMGKKN